MSPASVLVGSDGRPFTTAEALASGLTRRQLQGPSVERLLKGVYVRAGTPVTDAVRCQALRLVMPPGSVVCGLTAAWAQGVWAPPPNAAVPLQLARPLGQGPVERREVAGARHRLRPGDVVEMSGVPVESPMRTVVDLARRGPLVESVVVLDVYAGRGLVPLWQVSEELERCRRWPYVDQARVALSLADPRSESPGETRLRLVYVLAGLPRPLVNVPLVQVEGLRDVGTPLGKPDLVLHGPAGWAISEYDGGYHDEGEQPAMDRRRQNRLGALTSAAVLRYDRTTVRSAAGRNLALEDVCRVTGLTPLNALRHVDWYDPKRRFRW